MLNRIILAHLALVLLFTALVWLSLETIQVSYGFINMPQVTEVPEEAARLALMKVLKWLSLFLGVAVAIAGLVIRLTGNAKWVRNTSLILLTVYLLLTSFYIQRAHKNCIALERKFSTKQIQ